MDMSKSEPTRACAGVYFALAEALVEPAPDLQGLLLEATLAAARLANSDACRQAALALAELPKQSQARGQVYHRMVHGNGGRPLALYESLHRYGCLAGPATHAVEHCYRSLGLHPAAGELADHASLELAFLGHLAEAEADLLAEAALQPARRPQGMGPKRRSYPAPVQDARRLRAERRRFLRTHASAWLPEVGDALAATGDRFYGVVGRLLRDFLLEECRDPKRRQLRRGQLPVLLDSTACTLCGICIGACPTGALQMLEDRQETTLTLSPGLCVACARCVETCPENVLTLATGDDPGGGAETGRVIRCSPRAACPVCGTPTVSQAELDAVFTRLGAGTAMESLLSLCIGCKAVV
jgi:ferredoxin/nitrate reductase assembly molybdenum cofactor insertion protein NarJ